MPPVNDPQPSPPVGIPHFYKGKLRHRDTKCLPTKSHSKQAAVQNKSDKSQLPVLCFNHWATLLLHTWWSHTLIAEGQQEAPLICLEGQPTLSLGTESI